MNEHFQTLKQNLKSLQDQVKNIQEKSIANRGKPEQLRAQLRSKESKLASFEIDVVRGIRTREDLNLFESEIQVLRDDLAEAERIEKHAQTALGQLAQEIVDGSSQLIGVRQNAARIVREELIAEIRENGKIFLEILEDAFVAHVAAGNQADWNQILKELIGQSGNIEFGDKVRGFYLEHDLEI